jgi:hypothetical protein
MLALLATIPAITNILHGAVHGKVLRAVGKGSVNFFVSSGNILVAKV